MNLCPVCGYDCLEEVPYLGNDFLSGSFEICSCCGYQFGVDDLDRGITHEAHRRQWLREGAPWFSRYVRKPPGWNPKTQLLRIGIELI